MRVEFSGLALTPREQKVILMLLNDEGIDAIAAYFGVTPERMRQIRDKAIRKLRYSCEARKPRNLTLTEDEARELRRMMGEGDNA